MFFRRLMLIFIVLMLVLPITAFGESNGAYYTIEFEYIDSNGETQRGVAYERLDFDVLQDASGNVWFQWHPQDPQYGETIPELIQIFYRVSDGVNSNQYIATNPETGENWHRMAGTEWAPVRLLIQSPTGDELRQFTISASSPEELGISFGDALPGGNVDNPIVDDGYNFGDGFNGDGNDLGGDYYGDGNDLDDGYNGDGYDLDGGYNGDGNELDGGYNGDGNELDGGYNGGGSNLNNSDNALGSNNNGNVPEFSDPNPNNSQGIVGNSAVAQMSALSAVNTTADEVKSTLGVVLYDNAALYSDAAQSKLTYLPKDTVVQISEYTQRINGKNCYMVSVQNNPQIAGYLSEDAYKRMTLAEEQTYQTNYKDEQPLPVFNTSHANVIAGTVLRNSPAGMPIEGTAGVVNSNAIVEYLPNVSIPYGRDSYNLLWIYVRLEDGREGYIQLRSVSFMSKEAESEYVKPAQQMPDLQTSYATSDINMNPLRDQNTLEPVDTVRAGDVGKYLGKSLLIDKDIWLLMEFSGGKVGYVRYDHMTFYTKDQESQHLLDQKPTPELPALPSAHAEIKTSLTPIIDMVTKKQTSTIDAGQVGEFLRNDPNPTYIDQNKDLWLLMQFGQKKGYVKYDPAVLSFYSAAQEAEYLNQNKQAQQLPTLESAYARANADGTQILAIDTKNVTKLLNKDDVVQYLSYRSDAQYINPSDPEKKLWLLVDYGQGALGYVKLDTVTFMTAAQEKVHLESLKPSQSPIEIPPPLTPSPSPVAPQMSGLMKTNAQLTVLYYWNNIGSLPKAGLNKGTAVHVQEQVFDYSDGKTLWSFVQYETTTGFVSGYIQSEYLTPMTREEQQAYYLSGITPTPSPAPTYSLSNFSGYLLITKGQVNFRSGPSTTSSMTQRLQYGTIVRALDKQNMNDGYIWYYCESQGQTGYVRGDMLRELTVQEYINIVSTPSYNQGENVITPNSTAKPLSGIDYSNWPTQKPNPNATISFQTIAPIAATIPPTSLATNELESSSSASSSSQESSDFLGSLATETPDPFLAALPTVDPDFPTEEYNSGSSTGIVLAGVILALLGGGGLYGYSVYNKAKRKQSQEQVQRLAADARRKAQQAEQEIGKPAVRRPVQPGQPSASQVLGQAAVQSQKPGQPASNQRTSQLSANPPSTGQTSPGLQKPVQTGRPSSGQPSSSQPSSKTPVAAGAKPGARSGATGAMPSGTGSSAMPAVNPYARPQSMQKPRTQEVTSSLPRAQVDGKPVEEKPAQTQRKPAQAPIDGKAQGNWDLADDNYNAPQPSLFAKPATEKPRMPVAPPPTPVSAEIEESDENMPRRRRRRVEAPIEQTTEQPTAGNASTRDSGEKESQE